MSEITFETGHLPVCVDCQVKHAVDLKAHVEKGTPRYEEVAGLVEKIRKDLTMSKEQMDDYEKIRKVEHKLEDYQAVLREARHRLQEQTVPEELKSSNPGDLQKERTDIAWLRQYSLEELEDREHQFVRMTSRYAYDKVVKEKQKRGSNPEAPRMGQLLEKCRFEKEVKLEKEHFEPGSFRTLCPQCPQSRCALCPPELGCATRIIIGCRKGEFVEGRCRVGTETHVIYHGKA